jgi:hypothetical protein
MKTDYYKELILTDQRKNLLQAIILLLTDFIRFWYEKSMTISKKTID